MNARAWGLLLLLSLLWGSSFFFYKILVAVLPPVTVVLGRVGLAAIAMNLWLLAQGQRMPLSGKLWLRFLLLGFLNSSLPFVLIAWGETRISSGMASILNATTPIFMVAVAHWGTEDEKLSVGKAVGIALGILGVIVLVGPGALRGGGTIWGDLAVIVASCSYGFGGVYSRRFTDLSPLQAATGQMTGATILLLPLSLVFDQPWTLAPPHLGVWAAWLAIALVNTALAYVVYYRMVASIGVTYISLVTFLIPIIALFLGAVFLNESVSLQALAGMAIIALGMAAVDDRLFRRIKPRSIHHQSK
ncbi:MAG TPA: DMT family transporter [Rhizomicrobium sp.]|nr:DMT family transporter [Rhizomicrobium sp.]